MENQPLWCCFDRLRLASAPPCRFRARFAGRRSRWGVPAALSSRSLLVRRWCRVSSSGVLGPSVGPSSLYSPATEILSFFLESFEVVVEWFSSSHCWSLLHWRHLSVFRPASAGDRYLSGLRAGDCGLPLRRRVHARVWLVACLPLLREWRTATSLVPLMLCASTGIYFRSILASSRLSFVWDFSGLVQDLLLPRPLSACRSPLRLFTGWFLLAVVVSS